MGSGKRASMREGPLAALFRKTETDGLEAAPTPQAADQAPVERPTPTPEERLRHAFSTDVPGDLMAPVEDEPARHVPPPSASDYQWGASREEQVGTPQSIRRFARLLTV